MVASAHFGYNLDIAEIAKENASEFSYDPRLFPGARARLVGCKTSFLLFSSGNAVITGAKSEHDVVDGFNKMHDKLEPFFKIKADPHADKGNRYAAIKAGLDDVNFNDFDNLVSER